VGVPTATVRVTSVVPSRYCAPESIRNSEFGSIGAVGLGRDAVVHDRAVGAGAGNGVEAQVLEQTRILAERLQPGGGRKLVELAAGCLDRQPAQEAGHRGAVA
jgi:hypothetical protein